MYYTREFLQKTTIHVLRDILRRLNGTPSNIPKNELIDKILSIQNGEVVPERDSRGRPASKRSVLEYGESEFEPVFLRSPDGDGTDVTIDSVGPNVYGDSLVGQIIKTKGVFKLHQDGFGFIHCNNFKVDVTTDVYVSKNVTNEYKLRDGDYIEGVSSLREDGIYLLRGIDYINEERCDSEVITNRPKFDELDTVLCNQKIIFDGTDCEDSLLLVKYAYPLGKGQRSLVSAPKSSGKYKFIKHSINSVKGDDNIKQIALLIDETTENVLYAKTNYKCEIVYTSMGESAETHVKVAELVFERAKRLVEQGKDVILYVDGITRLIKAYNGVIESSQKTIGGVVVEAINKVKKLLGLARNTNYGSLTIISVCQTGSVNDNLIYDEISPIFNNEIIIEGKTLLADFSINYKKSYTNNTEIILTPTEETLAKCIKKAIVKGVSEEEIASVIRSSNGEFEIIENVSKLY